MQVVVEFSFANHSLKLHFYRNNNLSGIANYIQTEFDRTYNLVHWRDYVNDGKTLRWNCAVVPKDIAQGMSYRYNHNTRFQFTIGELRIDIWQNSD